MSWTSSVEPMLSAEQIQARVTALGREITASYQGQSLCVVGILKGSFLFLADLVRQIDLPLTVEFMGISSYGDATKSSGVVQITSDLSRSIEDENLLIVEDIVDTGLTMAYLLDNLRTRKPRSIRICSLLQKPENTQSPVQVDFLGFSIPNAFVVGYGLDYAGKFRNLPFIGVWHG